MIQFQYDASRAALVLTTALALAAFPLTGQAQNQPGWFVPDQARPQSPAARPPQGTPPQGTPAQAPGRSRPAAAPPAEAPAFVPQGEGLMSPMVDPQGPLPPLQVQLPPMPDLPPIPKGPPTPAAIVGILSVQDVLRVSTAYQQGDKELAARRNRLNEDAQKEQNKLRDLGQSFANERAKLTPEQIRAREKDYAEQVNESRRKFSERARIIQESGQYVMAQIERVIEQVAQQAAASRGINLVLNRAQILGTTADFDLTPQVAEIVNRVLPAVVIPPDGVSPAKLSAAPAGPRAATASEATPGKKP